jgi:hypothetical protein
VTLQLNHAKAMADDRKTLNRSANVSAACALMNG